MHRVYALDRSEASRRFGQEASRCVPEAGLTDVHTYLLVDLGGGSIVIDATFPDGEPWGGRSSMVLACGPGRDIPAGDDPEATKARLVAEHCDRAAREPFIAALARTST